MGDRVLDRDRPNQMTRGVNLPTASGGDAGGGRGGLRRDDSYGQGSQNRF